MKLRTGLSLPNSVPPLEARKEERVSFNTVHVDPPQEVKATSEVPSLTKIDKGIPPLQPVRRERKVVELSSSQSATASSVSAKPESGGDRREEVVESPLEVPPLAKIEKAATEIPQLTSFNTMEVVHLLLGRSVEDEEVVLLHSFSERYIRAKKEEELSVLLSTKVANHVRSMMEARLYDFVERQSARDIHFSDVSSAQKAKGVERVAGYRDSGIILRGEIEQYAIHNGISADEALKELRDAGYQREASFVYTWALVKVKIGHDFGAFKLSELMPNI